MDFKYKLSICMMVKNEEKNLKECLESLKPLIENSRTELIIVDTGSTDNTKEIAKEYTNKVYSHKWNNHFSEMRNITISYASGEWLFIIDADEVLVGQEEMLDLIQSGKLDNYNTVELKVRNFTRSDNMNVFGVSQLVRMFRNEKDFMYDGAVHNQPRFKKPILNTNIYLNHYGYLSDDKDLMEKKFQRTSGILKDELKKNPGNIYYQFQLAVSYAMYKDKKNALIEIKKAFDLINRKPLKERRKYLYMYGTYARILFNMSKMKETINICQKGIKYNPEYIDLYFTMAIAMQMSGEKSEAVKYYKKYIDLADRYNDLSISKDPAYTMYNLDGESKSHAGYNIVDYCCEIKDYEEAKKYLFRVENNYKKSEQLIRVYVNLKEYHSLKAHYDSIKEDEKLAEFFTIQLEHFKNTITPDESKKMEEVFSEGDDLYCLYNQIKTADWAEKQRLVREFFSQADLNSLPLFYGDILLEVIPSIPSFISVTKKIQNFKLSELIQRFLNNECDDYKHFFIEYVMNTKIRPDDFNSNRVHKAIANAVLQYGTQNTGEEKGLEDTYSDVFVRYLESGINYITSLYKLDKLRLMYKMIENNEDRFLISMYFYQEAIDMGNVTSAKKYIKDALESYPCMALAVRNYSDKKILSINEGRTN